MGGGLGSFPSPAISPLPATLLSSRRTLAMEGVALKPGRCGPLLSPRMKHTSPRIPCQVKTPTNGVSPFRHLYTTYGVRGSSPVVYVNNGRAPLSCLRKRLGPL